MRQILAMLLAACAVLMMVACGGANSANNAPPANGGHGDGADVHGAKHEMGEKDLEGYKVKVAHVEVEGETEAVFEVDVQKDGKAVKDASVSIWIGDAAGKELSPIGSGEWMADENLFDCHVSMPKDAKDPMLWVRIRHGGKDLKADFAIPKE